MHPVELYMRLYYVLNTIYEVTGHLSEGSFVRNVVVQILKFDAKPNHNSKANPNPNPNLNSNPNLILTLTLILILTPVLTLTLTLSLALIP